MSVLQSSLTDMPLTDGLTHISTLASSSAPPDAVFWKKSPLKTYSKKNISPVTVTPVSEPENDGKSRYGRARKFVQSADFLSTDKKVGNYLKVTTENQLHNYRITYSKLVSE